MKMKMLVFLVILALAPYLSAKISSQTNVDAMDGEIAAHIDVNEASGMVFTDEPNYYGTNAGFICDNNQYPRAYWKVGDSALVDCANDPNITPQLRGDGSLVLVFRLPVKPGGQVVAEAQLASYVGWITAIESVYLYGLRHVDACDVNNTEPNKVVKQSDYFVGSFGCDANATFIQKDYIQMPYPASRNSWHVAGYLPEDANGPDRLRCWLQKQYDEGAVGGDYVLLRLNISGYRPIDSYHQIQVSSMWDNPNHKDDINDINDMNSIPVERLTKTFNSSPRLFIQFQSGSAPACPNAGVYCCEGLPGDMTGNCHVDTNDLAIMVGSWLNTISVSEVNLLSRYAFEGNETTGWYNSVADACVAIPQVWNYGTAPKISTDPDRGKVADIHSGYAYLWVGNERAFKKRTPDSDANDANDANGITTQITVAAWTQSTRTSWSRVMGWGNIWYVNTVTDGYPMFSIRHAGVIDPNTDACGIELSGFGDYNDVTDGKWHHTAGTYNAVTGVQNLYKDGVLLKTQTHHAAAAISMPYAHYAIGSKWNYSDANYWDSNYPQYMTLSRQTFHGYIDEVRVYNAVLSAAEILKLASPRMPADVTGDNNVNLSDFAALAEDWLKCALFPDPGTECLK